MLMFLGFILLFRSLHDIIGGLCLFIRTHLSQAHHFYEQRPCLTPYLALDFPISLYPTFQDCIRVRAGMDAPWLVTAT